MLYLLVLSHFLRRTGLRFCGKCSVALFLSAAPAAAQSAADLAADFRALAFSAEFGEAGALPLARWAGPIVYDGPPEAAPHLARLAEITGLPITAGRGAALLIHERPEAQGAPAWLMGRFAAEDGFPCLTLIETDAQSRIIRAEILIKPDLPPERRRACLIEETAQAMGLTNDAATRGPSLFNDDDQYKELTAHDANLLRLLYDARLKPGMTAKTAAPLIEIIARELAAEQGAKP